jgi:hypothetical protein
MSTQMIMILTFTVRVIIMFSSHTGIQHQMKKEKHYVSRRIYCLIESTTSERWREYLALEQLLRLETPSHEH